MTDLHRVASQKEIPADEGRYFEIHGRGIAIFRQADGFVALDNECPHRSGPLADGTLAGGSVICPWHGWGFDCVTGKSPVNPHVSVRIYPVSVQGEDLYVDFSEAR